MDAETIKNTCIANFEANKTDCNHFVKAVSTALGVTLIQPGDDANQIVDRLTGAADWTAISTGAAARTAAEAGRLVIGGMRGDQLNPAQAHGHVLVVVKGELVNGLYPHAYWGKLGGVGMQDTGVNFAFGVNDRDHVRYFSKTFAMSLAGPPTETPPQEWT